MNYILNDSCDRKLDKPGPWTAADTAAAIKAGWQFWYSERDGLGSRALRAGEIRCPLHVVVAAVETVTAS